MAVKDNLQEIGSTYLASADCSAKQFHYVKQSGAGTATFCNASTDEAIGVLQNKPLSGEAMAIGILGVTKIVAGDVIAAGADLMPDASGRAITAATASNKSYGKAIDAATAAGQIIRALIPARARTL